MKIYHLALRVSRRGEHWSISADNLPGFHLGGTNLPNLCVDIEPVAKILLAKNHKIVIDSIQCHWLRSAVAC